MHIIKFLNNRRYFQIYKVIFILLFLVALFIISPTSFSGFRVVDVSSGVGISSTAFELYENGIIRYPRVFTILAVAFGGDSGVIAGSYFFEKPQNLLHVVNRVTSGEYGVEPIVVTIPEGFTVLDIDRRVARLFPQVKEDEILSLASEMEGYLFPDTYFFLPTVNAEEIIKTMRDNFDRKIIPLKLVIEESAKELSDVIIMASILEKEARLTETRRTIAGVLWKRLDSGIPLGVDPTLEYILGRNTYELTSEDLVSDFPYNTYKYTGLPPGPISNPGLDAIHSAVTPLETPYWFYLSDLDGNTHYSITFDEHKLNKQRYLR